VIIDAWAQHPTLRHMQDPIFESLRRWTRTPAPTAELPIAATLAAMDQAGIDKSLICAWLAPRKVMIRRLGVGPQNAIEFVSISVNI
jgi:hypothetical protein